MTHTPNDSLNSSNLMDLTMKVWTILHYPSGDPGSEYEIVSKAEIINDDSWAELKRGTMVHLKYGTAKLQGVVVAISDDYDELSKNFDSLIEQFKEVKMEEERRRKSERNRAMAKKSSRSHYRHTIKVKVTDKETQTDDVKVVPEEQHDALKREFEALQNKYNDLQRAVSAVKSELEGSLLKLDVLKNDGKGPISDRAVLQPRDENATTNKENAEDTVVIGTGGTKFPRHTFETMKWGSYTLATRKVLSTLFTRGILATHSLTGKPSPALSSSNRPKKTKIRLNPTIVSDIVQLITKKCGVSETLVRSAITTKCADENKMLKKRQEQDDENAAKKFKPGKSSE